MIIRRKEEKDTVNISVVEWPVKGLPYTLHTFGFQLLSTGL